MKKNLIILISFLCLVFIIASCKKDDTTKPVIVGPGNAGLLIINHNHTDLGAIPANWIDSAKVKLHIAYGHTSHGSQLTTGMASLRDLDLPNLVGYKGDIYNWNDGPADGALDLDDYFVSGDLGNPDRVTWASRTREYLANNSDVNVIIWSWCGEVNDATEEDINTYLNLMQGLENDFPEIIFVYMTGHLEGTGVDGNLNQRNEQIRDFCNQNEKVLYDFADIESYDPDGNYYLDKNADDGCNYYEGNTELNWAAQWQNAHQENIDWYECESQHSYPINANMKAYAAWHLWARLAGWDGQ